MHTLGGVVDESREPLHHKDEKRLLSPLCRLKTLHFPASTSEDFSRQRAACALKRSFGAVERRTRESELDTCYDALFVRYSLDHDMRALQVSVLQDVAHRHGNLILNHTVSINPRRPKVHLHPVMRMIIHFAHRGMLQDHIPSAETEVPKKSNSSDLTLKSNVHLLTRGTPGSKLVTVTTVTEHRLYNRDICIVERDTGSCMTMALFGEPEHQSLKVHHVVDPHTFLVEVAHEGCVEGERELAVDASITTPLNMHKLVPEVIIPLTTIEEVVLPIRCADVKSLLEALPPEPKPMTLSRCVELLHLQGTQSLNKDLTVHGRLSATGHVRRAYWTKGLPLFTNSWAPSLPDRVDADVGISFTAIRTFSVIALGRQASTDLQDSVRVSLWCSETRRLLASVDIGRSSHRENGYAFESLQHRVQISCGRGYRISMMCHSAMVDTWFDEAADRRQLNGHVTPELVDVLEGCRCDGYGYPHISDGPLKRVGMLNFRLQWSATAPPLGYAEMETFATRHQVRNLREGDWLVFRRGVSYAELLKHSSPQQGHPVKDFISHTWSEPTTDFMTALQRARCGSCWVCPFAVNQHQVDLDDDLEKSPFFKALQSVKAASGRVLMVLDEDATPLTRIWCVYEIWVTATLGLRFEMGTPEGLMKLGPNCNRNLQNKINRFKLDEAEATVEADRLKILQKIRENRPPTEADLEVESLVLRVVSQNATFALFGLLTKSEEVIFAVPWFTYWFTKVVVLWEKLLSRSTTDHSSSETVVSALVVCVVVSAHQVRCLVNFPYWGRLARWRRSQSRGILFFTAYSLVLIAVLACVVACFIFTFVTTFSQKDDLLDKLVIQGTFVDTVAPIFTVYVVLRISPWAALVVLQTATPVVHYGGFDGHVYYQAAPRFGFASACVGIAVNSFCQGDAPWLTRFIQASVVTWLVTLIVNLVVRLSLLTSWQCGRLLSVTLALVMIVSVVVCAVLYRMQHTPDCKVALEGVALFLVSRLWMVICFDMRPVWYELRRRRHHRSVALALEASEGPEWTPAGSLESPPSSVPIGVP